MEGNPEYQNLLTACKELIQQTEMSDFKDENGMALKMNECYDRLKRITEGVSK